MPQPNVPALAHIVQEGSHKEVPIVNAPRPQAVVHIQTVALVAAAHPLK